MMRLVHFDDSETFGDPIPFPGRAASETPARSAWVASGGLREDISVDPPVDSIRMVEDALDRMQRGLDDLSDALEPIPFVNNDDDGPWAA